MKVRTATKEDIDIITRMGCESFPSGFPYEERKRLYLEHPRRKLEEDVLIGEDDSKIVAVLSAIPYKIWLGGIELSMLGIAGVANGLDSRRRGYASKLCIEAIRRGREQGYVVSILYPFRYDFYRKLGWGAIGELIEYRVSSSSIPNYETRKNVSRFQESDLRELTECYQRFVEKNNCLAERSIKVWESKLKSVQNKETLLFVYKTEGKITGYIFFEFKVKETIFNQEIVIDELIYDDHYSYQGLLGFIGSLSDQVSTIRYWAQVDEGFHYILKDPRDIERPILDGLVSKTGNYGFSYMLRVLDVEKALKARINYNNVTATATLSIKDEQIAENNGFFQITLLDGKIDVKPVDSLKKACISLSIDVFSQIYAGTLSVKKAYFLGLITVNDLSVVDWLDKALEQPKPFLQEYF
ncbi:MAG: GNAT family N-acetyltransferase [Acidobacteria bacterium]|nr:GNAT family N-acetyltransferase [Acidobacteriota bacterium]